MCTFVDGTAQMHPFWYVLCEGHKVCGLLMVSKLVPLSKQPHVPDVPEQNISKHAQGKFETHVSHQLSPQTRQSTPNSSM